MASSPLNDRQLTILELLISARQDVFGQAGLALRARGDRLTLGFLADMSEKDIEKILSQVRSLLVNGRRGAKLEILLDE